MLWIHLADLARLRSLAEHGLKLPLSLGVLVVSEHLLIIELLVVIWIRVYNRLSLDLPLFSVSQQAVDDDVVVVLLLLWLSRHMLILVTDFNRFHFLLLLFLLLDAPVREPAFADPLRLAHLLPLFHGFLPELLDNLGCIHVGCTHVLILRRQVILHKLQVSFSSGLPWLLLLSIALLRWLLGLALRS